MKLFTATVTPEMAKQWLSEHKNIRPVNWSRVAALMADMVSGAWQQNSPQGLSFNTQGLLIDGQHRLQAQVRTGLTLSWVIAQDCPDTIVEVLDGGLTRAQSVQLFGTESSGRVKAQVARLIRTVLLNDTRRVTSSMLANTIQQLNSPGVDAVYEHSGKPALNTPVRAAFVYAWPCSPVIQQTFARLISGQPLTDVSAEYRKTFEVLIGSVNKKINGGSSVSRDIFFQVLRELEAFENNEGLSYAKSRTLSFERYTAKRTKLGLAVRPPVLPTVKTPKK